MKKHLLIVAALTLSLAVKASTVNSVAVVGFHTTGYLDEKAKGAEGLKQGFAGLKKAMGALKGNKGNMGEIAATPLTKDIATSCYTTPSKTLNLGPVKVETYDSLKGNKGYTALPEPKKEEANQWVDGHRVVEQTPQKIQEVTTAVGTDAGLFVDLKLSRKSAGGISINGKDVATMSNVANIEAFVKLVDKDGKVIFNKAYEQTSGLAKEDLVGTKSDYDATIIKSQFVSAMEDLSKKINKDLARTLKVK